MTNCKGFLRKQTRPNVKVCPGIWLELLRKNMNTLGEDSRFGGRYLNPRLSEYEAGVLTTRPHNG
jgi:hypothetical protein